MRGLARRTSSPAERLAELAVSALVDEAELSPKPALVDRRGQGAHSDLSLGLMLTSAQALQPCFQAMAEVAERGLPAAELRRLIGQLGRDGEAAMLQVTHGVNTHRGAIWALGLLVTATVHERPTSAQALCLAAGRLASLPDPDTPQAAPSHGQRVAQRYGVGGARAEAAAGFPAIHQRGLPQLCASRQAGAGEQNARLDALLAIMTALDDTCVLHRGGPAALTTMQQGARAVLHAGGSASLAGRRQLLILDRQLLAANASPGGAADLLAATLLVDRLEPRLPGDL
ncbi:triphosphoribosyl-dephospho-CoA synthase [Pseudomonas oryzihabitans]|uniref:Probable 2-(5''-triphosphoribosyl)-3'-dephosphocoenzyme-A synthase n=1 Tax=Pseudomonas oryzihabitans TaxID=47885 RepID=A0A2Z5A9A9_9PSED|nr:triphosphoribosyl-dephospho-CoA synthase [Pseudomonas oryzihabitans]AXA67207.1 triphosphoribosyl-dephospho-CoA synthase MdcB [Pseudomonas oryzihabitans]